MVSQYIKCGIFYRVNNNKIDKSMLVCILLYDVVRHGTLATLSEDILV